MIILILLLTSSYACAYQSTANAPWSIATWQAMSEQEAKDMVEFHHIRTDMAVIAQDPNRHHELLVDNPYWNATTRKAVQEWRAHTESYREIVERNNRCRRVERIILLAVAFVSGWCARAWAHS
jgi:hypothetical protein